MPSVSPGIERTASSEIEARKSKLVQRTANVRGYDTKHTCDESCMNSYSVASVAATNPGPNSTLVRSLSSFVHYETLFLCVNKTIAHQNRTELDRIDHKRA